MKLAASLIIGMALYAAIYMAYSFFARGGDGPYILTAAIESLAVVPAILLGAMGRRRAIGGPVGRKFINISLGCAAGAVLVKFLFETSKFRINLTEKVFDQFTYQAGVITALGLAIAAISLLVIFAVSLFSTLLPDVIFPKKEA